MSRNSGSIAKWKGFLTLGAGLGALLLGVVPAESQCLEWSSEPGPSPGDDNRLYSYAGTSAEDIWAVGSTRPLPGTARAWFTHFDGNSWTEIDMSALPFDAWTADEIELLPGGGVMIVGRSRTGSFVFPPTIVTYDGGSFGSPEQIMLAPTGTEPPAPRNGFPADVDILAEDEMWIVGTADGFGVGNASVEAMALHWDGSSWDETEVGNIMGDVNNLRAVAALSPSEVWAVGDGRSVAGTHRAFVMLWDGSSWTNFPSAIQNEVLTSSHLYSMDVISPDDIWAVGDYTETGGTQGALFLHWDGSSWNDTRVPMTPFAGARAVVANGADDVWAAGGSGSNVFFHFDGVDWSVVPGAPELDALQTGVYDDAMLAFGPCDVFAFGSIHGDGFENEVMIQKLGGSTASISAPTAALQPALLEAAPNPFPGSVALGFTLPAESKVEVAVFDVDGRAVRALHQGVLSAGHHRLDWDGRDAHGRDLPAGVYLYRVRTSSGQASSRVVKLAP
ncbi:MAG: FlgD immunoglobulin-like domain containing protein [Candidatus Eisenbacteria bacterium]